jgi:hypothetical protein|tara:strand:+ start:393 stop:536 length:144 start_codon:yes stop_codon:yes gene_type:complete
MTGQEAMDILKDRDIGSFTREELDEIQDAIQYGDTKNRGDNNDTTTD